MLFSWDPGSRGAAAHWGTFSTLQKLQHGSRNTQCLLKPLLGTGAPSLLSRSLGQSSSRAQVHSRRGRAVYTCLLEKHSQSREITSGCEHVMCRAAFRPAGHTCALSPHMKDSHTFMASRGQGPHCVQSAPPDAESREPKGRTAASPLWKEEGQETHHSPCQS